MKILYLNNYRGFQETFIPLCDVNFFLGENSTGKSSVLSILKIISNGRFWHSDEFNTDDIELGVFDELVSNNSSEQKQFEIGFTNTPSIDLEEDYGYFKAKYTNKKGEPTLSEVRFLVNSISVLVIFGKGSFKFKIKEYPNSIEDKNLDCFEKWIKDDDFSASKFHTSKIDTEFGRQRPSFYDIRKAVRSKLSKGERLLVPIRPMLTSGIIWIAPIRTKPKRIYESFKLIFSAEGNHTPHLIKNILANNLKKNITKSDFISSTEKFGKESGLFDKIEVKNLGKDSSSPFILNIYLNNRPLKITNVGYGVGQVLPLITEILVSFKDSWFSIQQPEVHLHPRAQAALGEFLFDAVIKKEQHFLIETHSDFLIDRFRLCLKKSRKKITSQVLFFERKHDQNIVSIIEIEKNGQYNEIQPKSFRNFFINEQLDLIQI